MFIKRIFITLSTSALISFCAGLLTTAILFGVTRRVEYNTQKVEFDRNAEAQIVAINEGLKDGIAALQDVNQLFAIVAPVTRDQFHIYVQPLLARYSYISVITFRRLIAHAQRGAYESKMRNLYPGFSVSERHKGDIVPAGHRPMYSVVDYVEPIRGNQNELGFDTWSNPLENAAVDRAKRTGLASATGLLPLIQDNEKPGQKAIVLLMPVYQTETSGDKLVGKQKKIVGYTAVVFRARDFISKILASRGVTDRSGVQIIINLVQPKTLPEVVFRSDNFPSVQKLLFVPQWLLFDNIDSVSGKLSLAGTDWRITVARAPTLFLFNHNKSLFVLVIGVFLSFAGAAYVYSLAMRAIRLERFVQERTAALHLTNQNLTEDIASQMQQANEWSLRARAMDASTTSIIVASAEAPDYIIQYVNPAFERISGYSAAEVIGRSVQILEGDGRDQHNGLAIRTAFSDNRQGRTTLRKQQEDGTIYWTDMHIAPVHDVDGKVSHFVVAQYDISDARRYESELDFQAGHDGLTGLATRNLLRKRLDLAIANSASNGDSVWMLLVDLDRFKLINESLGHEAGDIILSTIAERMQALACQVDTLARPGADQFALVFASGLDETRILAIIQEVMAAVSQPLKVAGDEFVLSCGIGVTAYPLDGKDADTLITHAEIAKNRAKELGHNSYEFYTPSMNERALERLRLEGDLRCALSRDEFVLHYQPQVDLRSGRITGMEALLRWQHPKLGLLSPDHFIAMAEESGLIIPIGDWVVRTACAQTMEWQRAGFSNLRVAVNLSARQFAQKDLVQSVAAVLERTGLNARLLEIELTESLVMADANYAIGVLHDLRTLGVTLSVDDFGTGHSSLSYLKKLPLHVLKIDRAFVRDVMQQPDDAAIVRAIISLAHSLRLHVIAEGVETAEQLAFLRASECDAIQGYYFSRPVPPVSFLQLLQNKKCLPPLSDGRSDRAALFTEVGA